MSFRTPLTGMNFGLTGLNSVFNRIGGNFASHDPNDDPTTPHIETGGAGSKTTFERGQLQIPLPSGVTPTVPASGRSSVVGADSYLVAQFIRALDSTPTSRTAQQLYGERVVAVTPTLMQAFSDIANSHSDSGLKLPAELEAIVTPGSEVSFYFEDGGRRVLLTVQHFADGSWGLKDTASNFMSFERFPVRKLRAHLQLIRSALLKTRIVEQFGQTYEAWKNAIPENVSDSEVMDLLLHMQGLGYYLDRGLVSEEKAPLTQDQEKKLAAIQYLVANNLTFWSRNARVSGVEPGIYPRDSVQIKGLHMFMYYFGRHLFDAMEKAGLEFVAKEWRQKRS